MEFVVYVVGNTTGLDWLEAAILGSSINPLRPACASNRERATSVKVVPCPSADACRHAAKEIISSAIGAGAGAIYVNTELPRSWLRGLVREAFGLERRSMFVLLPRMLCDDFHSLAGNQSREGNWRLALMTPSGPSQGSVPYPIRLPA
jgi:hypothetical protein